MVSTSNHGLSAWSRFCARVRMPLVAAGVIALLAGLFLPVPGWWPWLVIVGFGIGMALYVRVGTPHGVVTDVGHPVRGRWMAVNSPSSKVPSHALHAWGQSYAIDLVNEPSEGRRPAFSWWPLARRPEDFPGFGEPVLAPRSNVVPRTKKRARRAPWIGCSMGGGVARSVTRHGASRLHRVGYSRPQ